MCFILRAAQLTEPPANRSGTAAWKQQRRAEGLLPATPAPPPDCDRNRRLPSELPGSEPTKPSKAPGSGQTRDPPPPPGRFVFGRSRVFLFHTDPRERTQKQKLLKRGPFHNSPPAGAASKGSNQAVSGCPSARTNPEPGLGGPKDRPLRSLPVPSRITAPSPSVMENMRSEPVGKKLEGSEGCGGLWPAEPRFLPWLAGAAANVNKRLPSAMFDCLRCGGAPFPRRQAASWETGAACRLTRQHVYSLWSVWFQMGIFERTS